MKQDASFEAELSSFIVKTLETSSYGGASVSISEWSDLDGDAETFSTLEIEALLNDTVSNSNDQETVRSYLREQLELAPDAVLDNIPTDIFMDLLDIDGDNDFDGKDVSRMKERHI